MSRSDQEMEATHVINGGIIDAGCPLYACRVCRTKTGWEHQRWCGITGMTEPGCDQCRYRDRSECSHPALRKGKVTNHEENQRSF